MASNLKIKEAKEHVKNAEKYLKTSMFRWKPDFESAAGEYSDAAQCFRSGRRANDSKNCYLKAAEYHMTTGSIFHAAKCYESAFIVGKSLLTSDEIMKHAMEASSLYQQHGSGDSAAVVLAKAAKLLEEHHPDKAFQLYHQASDASTAASSQHQGSEYLTKASRLLVQLRWYDQAADSIRREIGYHTESGSRGLVGRLTVAFVLVQLARGDTVAAGKAYKEWSSYCEEPECQTIEQLLQAYDEDDPESAKKALSSPFIRHMDVEYSRLAATIPLPKGVEMMPRAVVKQQEVPYVSGQAEAAMHQLPAAVEATTVAGVHREAEETEELC